MKTRILLFVVCYQAEKFIESVLNRIPPGTWQSEDYEAEALIIDDGSDDKTFYRALQFARQNESLKITVLHNPRNQGYGGNQKIGYHYAVTSGFDIVVLIHGDGQYPPEYLDRMVQPILTDQADAVFGSRMMSKADALKGGMPLYKWVGNQILTFVQNAILGTRLSEFHTGYRAYRVAALKQIPFAYNSDYFDFDTDIIIQLVGTGQRMAEIPIPTHYGREISRVNGFKYAALIVRSTLQSRLIGRGIFYHPKFDYTPDDGSVYTDKLDFPSSHQFALSRIQPGGLVLDVGCGPGFMARALAERGFKTISIDRHIHPKARARSQQAIEADVQTFDFAVETGDEQVKTILLLDIVEHLKSPETLLRTLRDRFSRHYPQVILTTANVAFLTVPLGLLLGQFNYGKRGILDFDHARLFTFSSLRQTLRNLGYEIVEERGIPAPWPLALGDHWLSRLMLGVNHLLIWLSRSLFSYQIAVVARPRPTLTHLLLDAQQSARALMDEEAAVPQSGDGGRSANSVISVSR